MPTKDARRGKKADAAAKKGKARSSAKRKSKSADDAEQCATSEDQFVRGVLIRGEAAKPDKEGKMPPGTTHAVVEDEEEGLPKIERERFSLY